MMIRFVLRHCHKVRALRLPLCLGLVAALLCTACNERPHGASSLIPPGAHYVAMGSSFASGPGILPSADGPLRCARSTQNYAQQLAGRLNLSLTDVSCSGAGTDHILRHWDELPAQLDALQETTRLVTLTIGGNDLGYVGGLLSASCQYVADASEQTGTCWDAETPTPADFERVEAKLGEIVDVIARRAPEAQVVFVDYAAILGPSQICAVTPLHQQDAQQSRDIARKLEAITASVAQEKGAYLIKASSITKDHHACAEVPWMQGYAADADWRTRVPYHPTKEAMTAIADALEAALANTF